MDAIVKKVSKNKNYRLEIVDKIDDDKSYGLFSPSRKLILVVNDTNMVATFFHEVWHLCMYHNVAKIKLVRSIKNSIREFSINCHPDEVLAEHFAAYCCRFLMLKNYNIQTTAYQIKEIEMLPKRVMDYFKFLVLKILKIMVKESKNV